MGRGPRKPDLFLIKVNLMRLAQVPSPDPASRTLAVHTLALLHYVEALEAAALWAAQRGSVIYILRDKVYCAQDEDTSYPVGRAETMLHALLDAYEQTPGGKLACQKKEEETGEPGRDQQVDPN